MTTICAARVPDWTGEGKVDTEKVADPVFTAKTQLEMLAEVPCSNAGFGARLQFAPWAAATLATVKAARSAEQTLTAGKMLFMVASARRLAMLAASRGTHNPRVRRRASRQRAPSERAGDLDSS